MLEFCSKNGMARSGMASWRRQPVVGGGGEEFGMRLVYGEWDKRKTKVVVFCVSF